MKQQFTETSEVIITKEYEIPDKDIIEVFGDVGVFIEALRGLQELGNDINDLPEEQKDFINNLNTEYEPEEKGECWHGYNKGNVEHQWLFEE